MPGRCRSLIGTCGVGAAFHNGGTGGDMRRSEVAAPLIGAAVGALVAYLAQTATELPEGDCPTECLRPLPGHVTALGVGLGLAIGALVDWTAVFVVNRFLDGSLNDR